MTRRYACSFFLAISFFVTAVTALSQTQTQVATGIQPFGAFGGGPDVVNLGDLNVHLSFPLLHKTGRGVNFDLGLTYDSSVWGSESSEYWEPSAASSSIGWNTVGPTGSGAFLTWSSQTTDEGGNCETSFVIYGQTINEPLGVINSKYAYVDSMGNYHAFASSAQTTYCNGYAIPGYPASSGFPAYATDGSGIELLCNNCSANSTSGFTVILPNGQQISGTNLAGNANVQDTNGNYLVGGGQIFGDGLPSYKDTLGNQVVSTTGKYVDAYTGVAEGDIDAYYGVPEVMSYTGGDGNSHSYVMSATGASLLTSFGCSGIGEYSSDWGSPISTIQLPDSSEYVFTYELTTPGSTTITGRLSSVTFPHGGSISYKYGPINCADGSPLSLTRIVNDGNGHTATWSYQRSYLSASSQWQTVVTDPLGNQTVYLFFTGTPPTAPGNPTVINFYPVSQVVYSGSVSSGTILKSVSTCYNGNSNGYYIANCATPLPLRYPFGSQQVTVSPNGGARTAATVQLNNQYGLPYESDVYDFGSSSGTVGALLSRSTTSYAGLGQILNKPGIVTQYDGSGNVLSSTSYNYDEVSVTSTSGTPNLAAVTGSRGNLTSVTQSYAGGSKSLTSNYTYYDTGLVNTAEDVNGEITTYSYNQCENSFLSGTSQTVGATTLATQEAWNCNGGVPTSSTDVNGNTTSIAYNDLYWRQTSVTDPLGNTTSYSYPTTSSNTSEVKEPFNSGSSTSDVLTTYDGLSRPILTQKRQGPNSSTYDSVAVAYDLLGHATWQSVPYSAQAGTYSTTGPGVNTSYDAMGRPTLMTNAGGGTVSNTYNLNDVLTVTGPAASGENAKQRSLEYNAAGQLVSVCEITAGTGSGSCGQSISHAGYLTQYAYDGGRLISVKQNAQGTPQTRTISYDQLGRKISEVIPETGTSYFTYDSDSSGVCAGSYPGDLVKTVDNMGNVTCFAYDSLHRPLTSEVISGSYAPVTPISHFVYDAASLNGTAMANAKGGMAEAYTCSGSCATKQTDIFFSSTPSAGGSIAKMWESTPNSGGYFFTQTTSYANGSLAALSASLSGSSIGIPAMSYGVDGEGRQSVATDNTNRLSLVSSVAYNTASAPTAVHFGNGDSDGFSYDPNTGRPTQFQYSILADTATNVAAFNQTGVLTWNPNGSLKNFAFTDGNDSTKNQTCSYSLDDLSRLASASCGGAWAQTFTYDPFGNIQKSGTGSYMAGYNAMTNQVNSGVTAAYDLNGNQTKSTNAWLTWNAAAQPVTVTSAVNGLPVNPVVGGTYDALGRLVETDAITSTTNTNDSGTLNAVVGTCTGSASYSQNSTATSLASSLASSLNSNCSSLVSATSSGAAITFISKTAGTAYDYNLSDTDTYNSTLFSAPSFTLTPSSSAMASSFGYDNGTLNAVIGTCTASAQYGQNSTPTTLASSLATAINSSCSSLVSATSSGAAVYVTSNSTGTAYDYSLSDSSTHNAAFSAPSFTVTPSGSAMATTIFDSGAANVVIGSGSPACSAGESYGQGSTPALQAATLAAVINSNCSSLVSASVSGAVVSIVAKSYGEASDYGLAVTSSHNSLFSSPSFTLTPSGSTLTSASTIYDSGPISVAVMANGTAVCGGDGGYGQGATAATVAASLVTGMPSCSSLLTITANGSVLTLTAKALGAAADYTFVLQNHNNNTVFPQLSFTISGSGLSGGSSTAYATGTITIAGTEQSTLSPGIGTLTFAGTEQSVSAPGGNGYGGFTIAGAEKSGYGFATGSFTVAGAEQTDPVNTYGTQHTQYVYSPGGSKIAVVQNGALVKGTIPLPGGASAIYNASGLNFIRHKDWLGSSRLATTWAHGVYSKEAYAPFGETYNEAGTPDRSFTGQDQDTTYGVYDYLFRKYDPAAGRWLSPDPSGWGAVSQSSPQSLNRYAYVQNNPNSLIDANGLDCMYMNDDGNSVESIDHNSDSGECGGNGGTWLSGYVDEGWAHFNNTNGMFEAAAEDDNGQVNFAQFGAGAQTDDNGSCLSGCGGYGFASASADWLTGQLVGNSIPTDGSDPLDGLLTFMTSRDKPVSGFWKALAGPNDGSNDNWAGPNGMGPPGGPGDWRAAVHDYNWDKTTNNLGMGSLLNPTLSLTTSNALIQSNWQLMQTSGWQGFKEKMIFGPVNVFQWFVNSWK